MWDGALLKCPRLVSWRWRDDCQPRYLMTRNIKTQVNNIPPIMMNLSWVARLSMNLITVLERPNMLATSSIFLCVPCGAKKIATTAMITRLPAAINAQDFVHYLHRFIWFWECAGTLPGAPLHQKFLTTGTVRLWMLISSHTLIRRAEPGSPSPPWKLGLTHPLQKGSGTMRQLWTPETEPEDGMYNPNYENVRTMCKMFYLCIKNRSDSVVDVRYD